MAKYLVTIMKKLNFHFTRNKIAFPIYQLFSVRRQLCMGIRSSSLALYFISKDPKKMMLRSILSIYASFTFSYHDLHVPFAGLGDL